MITFLFDRRSLTLLAVALLVTGGLIFALGFSLGLWTRVPPPAPEGSARLEDVLDQLRRPAPAVGRTGSSNPGAGTGNAPAGNRPVFGGSGPAESRRRGGLPGTPVPFALPGEEMPEEEPVAGRAGREETGQRESGAAGPEEWEPDEPAVEPRPEPRRAVAEMASPRDDDASGRVEAPEAAPASEVPSGPRPGPASEPSPRAAGGPGSEPAPSRALYALQVAAYSREDYARQAAEELRGWGYEPYVETSPRASGGPLYRVRLGFASGAEARRAASELTSRRGQEVWIQRLR